MKRLEGASAVYQDGKAALDIAIREYDQTVLDLGHLRSSFVAGKRASHHG
jgi:hypothetical protein